MGIFLGTENVKAEEQVELDLLPFYKAQYEEMLRRVEAMRGLLYEYAVRCAALEVRVRELSPHPATQERSLSLSQNLGEGDAEGKEEDGDDYGN